MNPIESESEVIAHAIQGDRQAYSQLVVHYQPSLHAAVYRLCGDPDLAEDATQQAFIQAWLHLPEFSLGDNLRGWLYRVAVNATLDTLRREKHHRQAGPLPADLEDPRPGPEGRSLAKERQKAVQRALMALNESSRSILVLREYGGLSYREIAAALDIPAGTVMSRLNTARNQMRQKLELEFEHE